MQIAEELDYGGPQKYLLIKIVAKDCCQICIQRSEICILRKLQTIPLLKATERSDLATNHFLVPKITIHNSFTQFTEKYLIYVLFYMP